MLNLEERIILNIFIDIYTLNINNYINSNRKDLNIIFDIKHIPDKIVNIFFDKTTNYLNIILESSILYSLGYDNNENYKKYIDLIKYYKEKINDINYLDNTFKRLTLYNYIKFLLEKRNREIDIYKFDEFKINNLNLISHIKNNIHVYTIDDIEKNIIYKIMCKYDLTNIEKTILNLTTKKVYDKDIIDLSNNIIKNKKELLIFKKYIIRRIIFDAYISEYNIKKETIKEFGLSINNKIISNIFKKSMHTLFDDYINDCLEKNEYYLPKDKELLNDIINRYSYCFYYPDKEIEYIKNIDNEDIYKLSKINPYYKLLGDINGK